MSCHVVVNLNQTCLIDAPLDSIIRLEPWQWAELDLNQRRQSQRIYSPPPLTTRTSTQSFYYRGKTTPRQSRN